jgi:hypothetical protein
MKIKLIACEALYRELSLATAKCRHVFDLAFLNFGLHDTPSELRSAIQSEIDSCDGESYDYIALGYGLCSRGSAEVQARSIPLIIPRAHDCITLLLGSRARYDKEFASHPGTYYYSPGWIERKDGDVQQGFFEDVKASAAKERYAEYVEKYGQDNAAYLIEQESLWYANYDRAAFINMGVGDIEEYRRFTRELAADRGWEHVEIEGDLSLIERLTSGNWDSSDFLIVSPGHSIAESFDPLILKARP